MWHAATKRLRAGEPWIISHGGQLNPRVGGNLLREFLRRRMIATLVQMSMKGGEITPFPTPLQKPEVGDISPDGLALLLINNDLSGSRSLWIQSVITGDPRRVGELTAIMPAGDRISTWYHR